MCLRIVEGMVHKKYTYKVQVCAQHPIASLSLHNCATSTKAWKVLQASFGSMYEKKKMAKHNESSSSIILVEATSSRLSAEVRRARHRDRMQRQRLAEKKSIAVKRVEVQRLTCELKQAIKMLSSKLQRRKLWEDGQGVDIQGLDKESYEVEDDDVANIVEYWQSQGPAARQMKQSYLSLVLQQGTMTEENRRLSERFQEWRRFMKKTGVEHERLLQELITSNETLVHDGEEGRWVMFSPEEPLMFYQPIPRNMCHEWAVREYQRMQEVIHGPGARTLYNEAFGWKVSFSMHEDDEMDVHKVRMQHRSTKRISAIDSNGQCITGDTLALMTWKIISTPELYAQMYRSPMTSKILQQVDAHTKIMMRTFPDENAVMCLRFVCLVVQVQDFIVDETSDVMDAKRNSHRRVTIYTSLFDPSMCFSPTSVHTTNPMAEWIREGMSYLSFTEIIDENSVEIEYGGLMNVGSETASCTGLPFVAMNYGKALVSWEQLVTPMRTLSITGK